VATRRIVHGSEYQQLLELRTGLRRFLHWSEEKAGEVGLTPAQHQLLLAVKGHRDSRAPTVGDLADSLLLRHHSTVGLIDRAQDAGLVERCRDESDQRVVRVALTRRGESKLEQLTAEHLVELARLAPSFSALHPTDSSTS